jgi:hypothetical protein
MQRRICDARQTIPQFQGHFTAYRVLRYCRMTRGVKRFMDLRAWQACDVFKKAVYRLCENKPIADDFGRRKQIEE